MLTLVIKNSLRDLRRREVKVLFFMFLLTSLILSTTHELNFLLKKKVNSDSAKVLGADLIVSSSYPLEEKIIKEAKKLNLKTTQKINFFTMAFANDKLLLVNVNAINTPFPLNDKLKLKVRNHQIIESTQEPKGDEIWVDEAVLKKLNLELSSKLYIGEKKFKIGAIIDSNLIQAGSLFNFSPEVFISNKSLIATKTLQQGSRASYRLLVSGDAKSLALYKKKLNTNNNPHIKVTETKDSALIKGVYQNILNFINISMMMAVMLCVVAIALSCFRYRDNQLKSFSLLRTFGHSSKEILFLYLTSIRLIGFVAILSGIFVSLMLKPLICNVLSINYQEESLLFSGTFIFTMVSNVFWLMMFSLINFHQLKHLSVMDLSSKKLPPYQLLSAFLYLLVAVSVLFAIYYLTGEAQVAIAFFYLLLFIFFLAWLFTKLVLFLMQYLLRKKPLYKSYAIRVCQRNFLSSLLQVFAICVALTVSFTLWFLQEGLMSHWQKLAFNKTPNVFLINISPKDVKPLEKLLNQKNIAFDKIYPMIRGRVAAINNIPVSEIYKNKKKPRALLRELNLTTMDKLPDNNQVIEGVFTKSVINGENSVSVESGVAKSLNLKLNDEVSLSIANQIIKARVSSIRQVGWTSFKPNFFMVFNPLALENFPRTFITSFYISNGNEETLNKVVSLFPSVTIIDVSKIINQVQVLLLSIKKAMLALVLFSLIAACFVITLIHHAYLHIQIKEAKTFRLLGLSKFRVFKVQLLSPLVIGLISGITITFSSFLSFTLLNYFFIQGSLLIPLKLFIYPLIITLLLMFFLHLFSTKKAW